jgi:hypothetical protein
MGSLILYAMSKPESTTTDPLKLSNKPKMEEDILDDVIRIKTNDKHIVDVDGRF